MTSHAFRDALRGARISGNTVEFTSRAAISQTIVRLEAAGEGFRIPLFRAANAGALAVATAVDGAPVLSRILKLPRPTVVILSDDHPAATGPDGWPQARRLLRWSNAVVVHAAGGRAEDYAVIAEAAIHFRRLLLIEIEFRHMQAWGRSSSASCPASPCCASCRRRANTRSRARRPAR